MTRAHALALSDRQLKLVQQHAASLSVQQRDTFLRQIADQLRGEPSDMAVEAAVNTALDRLCSSQRGQQFGGSRIMAIRGKTIQRELEEEGHHPP